MLVHTKFHYAVFNLSEVNVLTNKK